MPQSFCYLVKIDTFLMYIINLRLQYSCQSRKHFMFKVLLLLNPHWHELWKQEKCSSLAPHRGIFLKTQWAWQGVKLTRLMSIFTSVWEIFDRNSADKIWSKKDKEIKVSPLMPIKYWLILKRAEDYHLSVLHIFGKKF